MLVLAALHVMICLHCRAGWQCAWLSVGSNSRRSSSRRLVWSVHMLAPPQHISSKDGPSSSLLTVLLARATQHEGNAAPLVQTDSRWQVKRFCNGTPVC
jgi:hypothetical protein